ALNQLVNADAGANDTDDGAILEVSRGIESVRQTGKAVELSPQPARVRKLQHRELEREKMSGEAVGQEPDRRIRILPTGK
ncbi:MAG: hypothetical protein IIC73_03930, partial [Armatimonadetes bacterium]|nr:hypothetical protein [Armatimonadota bacterium]